MHKPTDEELIEEIRQRFEFNRNALEDMRALTSKLEVMNEKLKDSESLKSQFLSNIRNEINNPLSAIMGLASQFLTASCDPDVCRRNARMIYSEAFNLDFQLQNIFMAAELEAGEAEPAYTNVDISSVIDSCIDKLSFRAQEKQVAVSRSLPDDLVFATDAKMFELILINLLANGVEFNHTEGKLQVQIEESSNGLNVAVIDNGPGIKPEDCETIFDRFRQLESGSAKGHRGHGLGLSISWTLAELLQGTLDVDSRPEQGSRFVLTLPRPQAEVAGFAKDANLFLFDQDEETETF
ncbi:MAG: hypothetical protein C0614_05260 [Desulfuromonas sp.]|nr:MAG: hypothetical protein C0614_05260 [Desulfuromonas sp.]